MLVPQIMGEVRGLGGVLYSASLFCILMYSSMHASAGASKSANVFTCIIHNVPFMCWSQVPGVHVCTGVIHNVPFMYWSLHVRAKAALKSPCMRLCRLVSRLCVSP